MLHIANFILSVIYCEFNHKKKSKLGNYFGIFWFLGEKTYVKFLPKYPEVLRTSVFSKKNRSEAEVDQKVTELKRTEALHSSLESSSLEMPYL